MVRLRPFKSPDADRILPWLSDERVMAMWCSDLFQYPLTREQLLNRMEQADRKETEWVMTGVDEYGEVVGHLSMWADYRKNSLHLGLIVVDHQRRGQGLGRQMLDRAAAYAFDVLGVDQVTLGVFDSNPQAQACYRRAGFEKDYIEEEAMEYHGEKWSRIHMVRKRKG